MPWPGRDEISDALRRVHGVAVAVLGDFAVDAYWDLDVGPAERSVETGRAVQRVARQRYGLGGAGNVAANLTALGARVVPIARLGADPLGRELRSMLAALGLDLAFVREGPAGWQTVAYVKPHRDGVEQDRIDLGARNVLDEPARRDVIADLSSALETCGGVVVNQQCHGGPVDEGTLAGIDTLVPALTDRVFLVDSRDHAAACRAGLLKLNAHEALALLGRRRDPLHPVAADEAREAAERIAATREGPLFVTLGADGLLVATAGEVQRVPAVPARGPIDPVGAGDTVTAALGACLVAGCDPRLSGHVASLAAAVTVRKLSTTGTATPAEILAVAEEVA